MKKLLGILVLILFTLQTPSQADDIRDFQIEGMSIGDSALDYFSEEEIIELGYFVGFTMVQQRFNRLLNLHEHLGKTGFENMN